MRPSDTPRWIPSKFIPIAEARNRKALSLSKAQGGFHPTSPSPRPQPKSDEPFLAPKADSITSSSSQRPGRKPSLIDHNANQVINQHGSIPFIPKSNVCPIPTFIHPWLLQLKLPVPGWILRHTDVPKSISVDWSRNFYNSHYCRLPHSQSMPLDINKSRDITRYKIQISYNLYSRGHYFSCPAGFDRT